jgi:hypothetical protein
MSFNLSTSIQRFGLAAAGTAIAAFGSMGSAHAFSITEAQKYGILDAPNLTTNLSFDAAALADSLSGPSSTTSSGANTISGRSSSFLDPSDLFRFVLGQNNAAVSIGVTRTGGTVTPPAPALTPTLALFTRTTGGFGLTNSSTLLGSGSLLNFASLAAGEYFLRVIRPVTSGVNLGRFIDYTATINVTPAPVPEPFTILGGAAALGVGGMMQRKRKKRQLVAQKAD